MENVIEQLDTAHLTDKVIKGWIAEVRKLAYHVEDVMDKYSYHALQMEEEGFLKKYVVKGSHYAIVFDGIVAEIVQIEQEIQRVIKLKDKWLQPSQLIRNKHSDFERKRSQGCLPELVKDEDLVGIEGNRMLLTGWLYSNELDSTVIIVSGMGGLGKTTIVANVYERGKIRFHAHAWIVVSQTYDVEELLRKDCGRNLKYLALSWCHLGEDPLSLLASHVPYLTFLRLNRVYTTKTLVLSAGCFPELKTLVLKHMPDVNKVEIEDRALPRIEGLHIVSLYNVKKVPEGIEFLRSLKKLWLLHLHKDFNTYWESNGMHEKMAHVQELYRI
ncbi:hypothetical protein OsI_14915 [Oryza sativa Indica Group]|uniref:Uncharacterized protein n=1 Tax=Oryza sativa subsp. indica TaxID=39946 RepID=B8AVD9_ORYSI|nr:hypothetical protein OsI_14915 [Oryza sativa Indica Group]